MVIESSDSDTEDEEHSRNRVGRIPMEWYDDYDHIGYDLDGKPVGLRPSARPTHAHKHVHVSCLSLPPPSPSL